MEEQKKFPKEQQVPRLWPSQLSHSSDTPYLYGAFCTHQHASPFPIAKQIETEQENRRKVARGRKKKKKKKHISSSGHFNCHFYKKLSKRVLKPNGVTGIY